MSPVLGRPKVPIPTRKSDALTQTYLWSFVVGAGVSGALSVQYLTLRHDRFFPHLNQLIVRRHRIRATDIDIKSPDNK